MGDDPDLDPDITKQFFETNVLKIQPSTLNEHGLRLTSYFIYNFNVSLFFCNTATYNFKLIILICPLITL